MISVFYRVVFWLISIPYCIYLCAYSSVVFNCLLVLGLFWLHGGSGRIDWVYTYVSLMFELWPSRWINWRLTWHGRLSVLRAHKIKFRCHRQSQNHWMLWNHVAVTETTERYWWRLLGLVEFCWNIRTRDVFEDNMVEAKAKARSLRGQGQGCKILSSSCPRGRGQSSRTPSLIRIVLTLQAILQSRGMCGVSILCHVVITEQIKTVYRIYRNLRKFFGCWESLLRFYVSAKFTVFFL